MRKLFGCLAVLAVTAAVGMFLAADHARRHPDSFVGRSLIATYRAAVLIHPLPGVGQAAAETGQTLAAPPREPGVAGRASIELEVRGSGQPPAPCGGVDLNQCRLPGRIIIHEEEEASPTAVVAPQVLDEMKEWPVAGAVVELIPEPRLLEGDIGEDLAGLEQARAHLDRYGCTSHDYPCIEILPPPAAVEMRDDAPAFMPRCEDDAPAIMPYADEPAAMDFLTFWRQLFRRAAGCADCCKEAESEARDDGQPPDCREDPHHFQQYPGCPYMGCPESRSYCPYSGRRVIPAQEPEKKSKEERGAPESSARPPLKSAEPRQQNQAEECEGRPRRPFVDTMDFRPCDAKPGEFGLIPF